MTRRLHFPYMFWAHHEGFQSPWCLSQSGMPAPEASFLDGLGVDIAHPCVEAQPALEAQLAELFHVPVERVRVTVGASSAMQFAAMRWFRSGSRVAAETPSYEPLRRLPEFYGADVRLLERRAEDAWLLEPDQARAALSGGSGPGHVFLTNLHNPTGAFLERERMQALAAEAEREGGLLVACEVYMEFVPNERRVHAFELAPNGVSIGGLTKAYGLGGLRIGWMILGEAVAEQALELTDMAYLAYVDPPTPSVQAARRALENLELLRRNISRVEVESRPLWETWLRDTPGIECDIPEFGLIAFPRLTGIDDTADFVTYLQAEHQVDVVPGEYFGRAGHVRVGNGVPPETLREGLERFGRGVEAYRARRG